MSRVETSVITQSFSRVAEPTGLEPATSDVTGRRSNQLNYDSALRTFNVNSLVKLVGGTGFEPVAPGL
jgi:hypothetical protein